VTAPDAPASRMSEDIFTRLATRVSRFNAKSCDVLCAEARRAREREAALEKALREIVREAGFNASTPSLGIQDIGAIAAAALALA